MCSALAPEAGMAPDFLKGGGEMGALMRALDWSRTPIGPVAGWSQSLRMMVSFLLANRFPLLLWWGPDYVSIYNDAYRPILGAKHPKALGQPVSECWAEIWHILKPLIDTPFTGGPATWMEDLPLEINRHGFVEETHFTVAYSPVPDESAPGGIGGVLATVHEISDKVIGERRVVILRDLGSRGMEGKTAEEACAIAAATLANHGKDLPFALLYLIDAEGREARLAGASGIEPGAEAAPPALPLEPGGASPWPLAEAVRREERVVVDDLAARFGRLAAGPWSDPPGAAVLVPIRSNKAHRLAGVLVAGASPRLRIDGLYLSFLELVAAQIATSIANARAYEEERRRAEALAAIDRAKTAFFSNVSHEFRTPLTLMLSPIEELLARAGLAPESGELLSLAHRNALRLLKLVNALLDFSRIEAGRVEAVYEPVDLAALTAELASNFRSAMERAGLELKIDCPPLAGGFLVDRDMWEKIVLNLVSNAFKFTFAGSIAVSVRPSADGGGAEVAVTDTGIGIPPAELPRLFDRFHRVEGARGRSVEGSGIGLSLVHELVKLHGGRIGVESELDRGSRFTVHLPAGDAHLPADRIRAKRTLASTSVRAGAYVAEALRWLGSPPQGELLGLEATPVIAPETPASGPLPRIVFADDNADMREYVSRLLSGRYEVEAVADGSAALEAAQRRRPALLLTDVMMPGLDGFQLLDAIRGDPSLQDLPVILLSARAGEEARVEGLDAGADDYLTKPFAARELLARIGAVISLAETRREAGLRLRVATEAASLGAFEWNLATDSIALENDRIYEIFGRKQANGALGKARFLEDILHPDDRRHFAAELERGSRRGGRFHTICRIRRQTDGELRWIEAWGLPQHGPDGTPLRLTGVVSDITERKRAEDRIRFLMGEVNHRTKNLLAVVQAVARQTAGKQAPRDFAQRFSDRLAGLAASLDLLVQSDWRGVDLRDLVRSQLVPFTDLLGSRIRLEGEAVRIGPAAAQTIGMALHELVTNAAKYGALSDARGSVEVNWRLLGDHAPPRLKLVWSEQDGPPVRPAEHRGFGYRVMVEMVEHSLDAEVSLEQASAGLVWEMSSPLERILDRGGAYGEAAYSEA